MADILIRLDGGMHASHIQHKAVEPIYTSLKAGSWVYGEQGTFCTVQDGEDAIGAIGYLGLVEGESIRETLCRILESFREDQVRELKERLVGQYVLVVKKGSRICIFADVLGARNVFYSEDCAVISSSFSDVEAILKAGSVNLDEYKVLEYLAMRHVLYPAWLGRATFHKRIKWLLPYEFISIDLQGGSFRLDSVTYSIENRKERDCSILSSELLSTLSSITFRKEFEGCPVGATLTGGHDSRLIAAIAARKYENIHFRIATSTENPRSLLDWKVAEKVARARRVPLDVYEFQIGRDEERFYNLTEGFSPSYNHTVAPLLDGAARYSLGLGGAFGTEMFMPIPWGSIDEFIRERVQVAQRYLRADDKFWRTFGERLLDQFGEIKSHYRLTNSDERDYIRLFGLLVTARYGSFILSAFNRTGYQLDPYGSYALLALALRVSPALWGDHRRFGGNGLVQKGAMRMIDPRMGRILAYMHSRPMLPLTILTAPLYLIGFILQAVSWLRSRQNSPTKDQRKSPLPGGTYQSDGWEEQFLRRTADNYGLHGISENSNANNPT
jgi:hypothetical protein